MKTHLAIHSSPRFSTWIWLADWRLLLDAGDGASAQLGYKLRKVDTVALTHAHRDHIGGLLQVVNQRGEAGSFALVHPCGSRSFSQLESFSHKFNPGSSRQAVWHALEEGDEIPAGAEGSGERILKAFRTRHYLEDAPQNPPRSLGYHLLQRKLKVKPELRALPQAELDALRARVGREGITEMVNEKFITIGGDGAPLPVEEARGAKLLLHEATFLSSSDRDSGVDDFDANEVSEEVASTREENRAAKSGAPSHGHVHSTVEEAMRVAREAEVENLVLYHISTRYTDAQIRDAIRETAAALQLKSRVWAAMPRRIHWDLLSEKPLWE